MLRSLLLAAALTAPLLAGCSETEAGGDAGIDIVTSTNVYADIATAVGGPEVDVTAFIDSPSADPHSYEANSRNILTVTRADIVVKNGGGYDDFMDQLLDTAKNDPVVIDAVDVADIPGDEANEHVWYDLAAMQQVAETLADDLAELDPDNAEIYSANAKAFKAEVERLRDDVAELSKQFAGTPVAITEPVPGFLIDDLGLENLTPPEFSESLEAGEDVSVGVLDETLRLFTEQQVDALIYNEQTSGPITDQVKQAADDAGIPIVGVAETLPEGMDYVEWMSSNIDAIASALGQS